MIGRPVVSIKPAVCPAVVSSKVPGAFRGKRGIRGRGALHNGHVVLAVRGPGREIESGARVKPADHAVLGGKWGGVADRNIDLGVPPLPCRPLVGRIFYQVFAGKVARHAVVSGR